MTATVALMTLLLAPAASAGAPAPAAPAACQSFSRGVEQLPPLIRAWFAESADERVLACPQASVPGGETAAPLYFGEGAVTQHGEVCSYLSHGLTLAGSGEAARLRRYDRSDARAMALAGAECPQPHGAAAAAAYVDTYDVSSSAFVAIMRLWSAATRDLAAADPKRGCCASTAPAASTGVPGVRMAPEARARLEAAIDPGRINGVSVTRIVRIPGSVLRHRYALFITVPGTSPASSSYVLYVDKSLRSPYEITAFAETN